LPGDFTPETPGLWFFPQLFFFGGGGVHPSGPSQADLGRIGECYRWHVLATEFAFPNPVRQNLPILYAKAVLQDYIPVTPGSQFFTHLSFSVNEERVMRRQARGNEM